jgi:hypothetical protein
MSSFHRSDWLSVVSPIVTLLIVAGGYYIAYFQEKGKNRAAAEDVGKLTRVVESIKKENAAQLAEISHQNAVLIEQCQKWWNNNCLYLGEAARNAFNRAFFAANDHKMLTETMVRDEPMLEIIKSNFGYIRDAGDAIVRVRHCLG